jgi:hypothetical protein
VIGAHEYGHHVAANRANDPWQAIDWGPKRWAAYAGICGRVAAGTAFPGDEGENYVLNPGEAWAETYRLAVEARTPLLNPAPLTFFATTFPVDTTALQTAVLDVLQPWAQSSTELTGSLVVPKVRVRVKTYVKTKTGRKPVYKWVLKPRADGKPDPKTFVISTPYDGVLSVSVGTVAPGATLTLTDPAGTPLAPAGTGATVNVCGQREFRATLSATGPGAYRLGVSKP